MADILTYYEKDACLNSDDRGFIITKGFQEWLLAFIFDHTVESAALKNQNSIYTPHSVRNFADIVILMANLVGGAMDEPV